MSRSSRLAIAILAAIAAAAAVIALAASGLLAHRSDTSPGRAVTIDDLQGTYVSTTLGSVTPEPLVDGHPITIGIDGDQLDANAGCNSMGGTASLVDGRLIAGPLVQTMMACVEPGVMKQEAWVRDMLQAGPTVTASDGGLVLTWQGYTLALNRASGPTPSSTTAAPTPTATDRPLPTSTMAPLPTTTEAPLPSLTTPVQQPSPSFNTIPETPQGAGS